jgi:hypothetical protein
MGMSTPHLFVYLRKWILKDECHEFLLHIAPIYAMRTPTSVSPFQYLRKWISTHEFCHEFLLHIAPIIDPKVVWYNKGVHASPFQYLQCPPEKYYTLRVTVCRWYRFCFNQLLLRISNAALLWHNWRIHWDDNLAREINKSQRWSEDKLSSPCAFCILKEMEYTWLRDYQGAYSCRSLQRFGSTWFEWNGNALPTMRTY